VLLTQDATSYIVFRHADLYGYMHDGHRMMMRLTATVGTDAKAWEGYHIAVGQTIPGNAGTDFAVFGVQPAAAVAKASPTLTILGAVSVAEATVTITPACMNGRCPYVDSYPDPFPATKFPILIE
jgi:hypothetical protein